MPKILPILSSCLGNLFEHYENAIFGFLSPFLAPLIFPHQDPLTALILTYALFPLGMLGRPIGALIFGYIGDVYGRARSVSITLAGMSVVSFGIALCPTYAEAGIWSPILFVLGRILQNGFAAGETMGGAIYLLDHTEKRQDLLSSFYSAAAMIGIILASFGVAILSHYDLIVTHWRWLYILGCVTGVCGWLIRRSALRTSQPIRWRNPVRSLKKVFQSSLRPFLLITIASGFVYSTYSIALLFTTGFLPLVTSFTHAELMELNTYLLVIDACALPFFGWLAERVSRHLLMLTACVLALVAAIPLCYALEGASYTTVVAVRICFVLIGVAFFAPFHVWARELVPPTHRYTVISVGYAVGTQLLGGPTAVISLWLFKQTGMAAAIGWYWMLMAAATTYVMVTARKLTSSTPPEPDCVLQTLVGASRDREESFG